MSDKERVRDLQRKLYLKAKREKGFRFYVMYDKVRLPHFLREAYRRCRANRGKPGVDGLDFEEIEKAGVDDFLKGIRRELEERTYRPAPVLRGYIPKVGSDEMRPLGIPTIKDRVVQMSCKMVIEPIFEADFEDSSYGFRPKRSAHDAVREVKRNLQEGRTEVFDADLKACFDTIPHRELLILIGRRISDKNIIHLIKMWLKTPVIEGSRPRGGKKNKIGVPQGGVISPLLANIYLSLLNKAVERAGGVFAGNGIKMIRYADDFILAGRRIPEEAKEHLEYLLSRMKLTLNRDKSRVLNARNTTFDFLGFTFRHAWDRYGRCKRYWDVMPRKGARIKVRGKIREHLGRRGHLAPEAVVRGLNMIIRGWVNYSTIPGVSYPQEAKRELRYYLFRRLRRYYRRKSQRGSRLYKQGALDVLVGKYGLIDPSRYQIVPRTVAVKA